LTSGARIGKFEPSALDAEQRSLYDAIAGGRRAQGPQLFMRMEHDKQFGGGALEGR
jgi:4-carboxymuconolactone decarboxylase